MGYMSSDDEKTPDAPSFPDFVDALNDVDESDATTKDNPSSMSDNNGGRIKFNEDGESNDILLASD